MFRFLFITFILLNISASQDLKITSWQKVADGLSFPEGPAWDYNNTLYVSNCYGDWITRINGNTVDTFLTTESSVFKQTNGLTFGPDGMLYGCDFGLGAIVRFTKNGKSEIYVEGFKSQPFNRPNDLLFDQNGNMIFSDPKSYGKDKPDGRLFFVDAKTQAIKLIQDGLTFPNGLAISPVDKKLYLSESAQNRILQFSIDEQGNLSEKKVFIELPGGDPDGLAFDIDGNLYVAHFGTGNLYIINSSAEIIKEIKTPGQKPSNLEFSGADMKTLFITEDQTNAVYKAEVNIPGVKLIIK